MPELSIIVINYNTFDLTTKCIASIYEFTVGLKFEIILVDNASTECSPDKFKRRFKDIILIKSEENLGFSKGNNLGLSAAKSDFILLLNSDTEFFDNSISLAYKKLIEKDSLGAVTAKLMFPDYTVQPSCGKLPSIKLQLMELFRVQKLFAKNKAEEFFLGNFFKYDRPIYPEWAWGTFFMFRKSILNYFPNYKLPETYFMYCEDYEWGYYISKSPFKILFHPDIQLIHHAGSSHKGKNPNNIILKNYEDFLQRYYGKVYSKFYFLLKKIIQLTNSTLFLRNFKKRK